VPQDNIFADVEVPTRERMAYWFERNTWGNQFAPLQVNMDLLEEEEEEEEERVWLELRHNKWEQR